MRNGAELDTLDLGSWVIAELPRRALTTRLYDRQVLAVWAGVRWEPTFGFAKTAARGVGILAQRWYPETRRLGREREKLLYVRAATRIDMAARDLPIGRPVYRALFDPTIGPVFVPLVN